MKIELRALDEIKPYPGNPRINDEAVGAVVASLKEFGFRQPIVVDADGVIIVGHTRWKAAQVLGLKKVPVHVATDLSAAQVRAYRIADNQTATIADWDFEMLAVELSALEEMNFDLELLGFDADELIEIMAPAGTEGLTDADEVPEAPEKAVTQPGDLWILGGEEGKGKKGGKGERDGKGGKVVVGGHRLLCGDSTKSEDVDRLMDGAKAALVATDPPYLVDYTGERPNDSGKDWSATYREIDITDADGFFRGVFTNILRVLAPHGAIYCWHAHKRQALISAVWADFGILDHQQVIWVKPTAVFGRVYWHFQHEPCMMGWKQGSQPVHDDDHSHSSVWEIDWEGKSRIVGNEHPTQKPVEIFARPMRKHTKRGAICFEPFSGSGSQIIAAEKEGRRCFAIELEPKFVDVALERWAKFTGKEPVLAGTGRTLGEVRAERIGAVHCG